jgi:hypothetical protein
MRKVVVIILAVVALGLGGIGGLVYGLMSDALGGVRVACAVLDTAEGSSWLDKAQRADVVDRFIREMNKNTSTPSKAGDGLNRVFMQLKTGCPSPKA